MQVKKCGEFQLQSTSQQEGRAEAPNGSKWPEVGGGAGRV